MSEADLKAALQHPNPSTRLHAALKAGTRPHSRYPEIIVQRCAIEPDFPVREMLTWALTRHPNDTVFDLVIAELSSPVAQARAQALHTLTKLHDARAWNF